MFKGDNVTKVNTSDDKQFVMLSNQIRADISEGKVIEARPLLELAKKVIKFVTEKGEKRLPEEFRNLTERAENYWRYKKSSDYENELSYARGLSPSWYTKLSNFLRIIIMRRKIVKRRMNPLAVIITFDIKKHSLPYVIGRTFPV